MGRQAKDRANAGYGYGAIVVLLEGLSSKTAGVVDDFGAAGQGFEQIDQASDIARFDMPAAAVFFDDAGGRCLRWSDEQDRAAGSHDAVGLAGYDRSEGFGKLGDETDVALGEAKAEIGAIAIGSEHDVVEGALAARSFEPGAAGAPSGEQKAEARVTPEMLHGIQDGIHVVNDAEVAGVIECEGAFREWTRSNIAAVSPVFAYVNLFRWNAMGDEAVLHLFTEGNDTVGAKAGEVEDPPDDARERGTRRKDSHVDSDVGIEVHFPDVVAGAPRRARERPDQSKGGGRGEGDYSIVLGTS